ncbi:reverse transcriptase family protein [Aeoliella mucimassa]|uniref:RNA-directed DNA polymerase n=1 Tax=Aeoliella mucimassa TaxID=2527972 RepID=A0A518AUE7_9BACT|nr:reverse transcriptase family protein [Aeoliella mucimassa]QDU58349.1 Reverse transcriptase (RNA-dependent DNA polymerase) [Aeoliella mucimassa]
MGLFDWISNLFGGSSSTANPPKPESSDSAGPQGPASTSSSSSPAPTPPQPPRPGPPAPPKSKRLEGLDASQFAPIEEAAALRQAKSMRLRFWTSTWFGLRDRIPPASDERTKLVDRLMVADGLATPEELAEIHEVGAEMDRLRPALDDAAKQAGQAVSRNKEDRAKLKAQKKAEAAERKRLRADAIAERKRNDIVFLGRGVSRGLADRESNAEKLEGRGLPVLHTPSELATAIDLPLSTLRWLAYHNEAAEQVHYVQFQVRKKSGGIRVLASPHKKMRRAQQWILDNILTKIDIHEAAHGFVAGRSTVTNAAMHVGQQVVVNVDLQDFFPSVTFPRVEGFFRSLGYSGAVATILALLVTESPRQRVRYAGKELWVATGPRSLPQGACTSPALSNAISWTMDTRLTAISSKLGWSYSRYADDLTFSTAGEASQQVGYLLARIRHITQEEGFGLNRKKTRVQRRSAQQSVTGIVVNDRAGVARKTVRQLRAILHNAKTTGLAAQNREGRPDFEAWLQGMIAYVRMVNPEQAASLTDAYEQLRY